MEQIDGGKAGQKADHGRDDDEAQVVLEEQACNDTKHGVPRREQR